MLLRHWYSFRHELNSSSPVEPIALTITSGPTASGVTVSGASISWSLSTYATGQVHYGTTTAYGSTTTEESSFDYASHVQSITGLSSGTLYHFKVVGEDALGNPYDSGDFTFTTLGAVAGGYPTPAALVYSATVATTAPTYLNTVTDGNYSTEIARVGQNHLDKHTYSSIAAWNSDGTRFAINYGSGHEKLFDTTTTPWSEVASGITVFDTAMSWSDSDPTKFYRNSGSSGIARYTINLDTGATVVDTTWSVGSHSDLLLGGWQGQMGGNYVPYTFDSHNGYGVLNISTGDYWETDTGSSTIDAVFVSPSGAYFIALFNNDGTGTSSGVWAFESEGLVNGRQLSTTQDHGDTGSLANGDQVWIMGSVDSSGDGWGTTVQMWNLDDSDARTQLLDYWPSGHFSCRNLLRPGYVYVSNELGYGTSDFPGRQDIFAIDLSDPPAASGNVEYYAKAHAPDPRVGYASEPQACPSPDGTIVAFTVGWDGSSTFVCYVAGVDTGM